jgi:hypothetical protein
VFNKSLRLKSRFLQNLKLYSTNSLLLILNDLISCIAYIALNTSVWQFNSLSFFDNSTFTFYYFYIYSPIWNVLYTFGGLFFSDFYSILLSFNLILFIFKGIMDMLIVYTRIQILYPRLKFLAKVSVYKISAVILLICVVINIPINLGKQVVKERFNLGSNTTLVLETYG